MPYNQPKSQVEVQDHLAQKAAWKMTDAELTTELTSLQGSKPNLAFTVSKKGPSFTAAMSKDLYGKSFGQLAHAQKKVIINVDLRARKSGISTPKMHIGDTFTISVVSGKMMFGFKLDGATNETNVELFKPNLNEVKTTVDESRLNLVHLQGETVIGVAERTKSIVAVMRALGYNPTKTGRRAFLKNNSDCVTAINASSDLDKKIDPAKIDTTYVGTAKQNLAFVSWVVANADKLVSRGSSAPAMEPPVPEEPPVVAAPPVPEEPPVVAAPPVPEEPPVVAAPPVPAEPPVVAAPPVPEEPPVVAAPPVPEPVVETSARSQKRIDRKKSKESKRRESAFDKQWKKFSKKELTSEAVTAILQSDLEGARATVNISSVTSDSTSAATITLSYAGKEATANLIFSVEPTKPYNLVIMPGTDSEATTRYDNLTDALAETLQSIKPKEFVPGEIREVNTSNFDAIVKGYDGVSLVAFGTAGRETARQLALVPENENLNVVVFADPNSIVEPYKTAWLGGADSGFRFYKNGQWKGDLMAIGTGVDALKAAAPETD